MALLWIDSFDNYGTTIDSAPAPTDIMACRYPVIAYESFFRVRAGRLGAYALDIPYDNSRYFGATGLTTEDTVVAGFAIQFANFDNNYMFFALMDGSTVGISLSIQSTGEIKIRRGNASGTLLATAITGMVSGNWYYLELKVKCNSDSDTGTYELRIGEQTVASDTANTKAGAHDYHDGFRFYGTTGFHSVYLDDFYFLDVSGSVNNDLLGNMRVIVMRPDSAGDSTQFTPDSGNNYARVNEAQCDDDTSYVEDATSDHKDLYNYGELVGVSFNIKGVAVYTNCRETDATSFSLITVCKSDVTESDDTAQAIGSTNYVTRKRILETDPHTSAAWTKAALDAVQFGVKVA